MVNIDLWKDKDFRIKDGALLCLFLMGTLAPFDVLFYLFRINLKIMERLAFLGMVLIIARRFGNRELPAIMKWRKISAAVFCSLIVMFSGIEMLRLEAVYALQIILPIPEGFFGTEAGGNVMITVISGAVFPAFTEEIFFRGILLRRLRRRYTERRALAVGALLFGAMHLNPWQALTAFIAGLFLGWIYMRFKTIWPCIFFHAYSNVLASFMVFPAIHPLLFVMLGALLFLAGWGLTASVS
jgi:membrane protease YdiL (CAAX protease family)